ncbi:Glucoamylase (glucan-1,4-alpha-glucosidase), GH15 family [Mariniphaga anaerophila]|uniref:Glucoamylase (Glucan-1,4-alpha-glucosidase), GH15 family n=1 Tax=Mariniphaga anaerophila TaxID=1484053 RepID=A0A1M5FGN5_9BACT|nr:glycoside hydrolase family 15 protein [Mariniphaga anaerophila]SHF90638.1 Glucoamylase (glucan-1,4-alpha-glucosidase), GH15 family [Mariniphaga anaerophila]
MTNLDYGIIGNCSSAALISKSGALEWLCLPVFDSASIFAKLLDKEKGGSFEFIISSDYQHTQRYLPKTNILVTKYSNGNDCFEVIDFMPRYHYHNGVDHLYSPPDVIRYVKIKSGTPKFRVNYNPKLEYAEKQTTTEVRQEFIKSFTRSGAYDSLYLYTNIEKEKVVNGDEIELTQDAYFLISYNQKLLAQSIERSYLKLQRTKVYWLNWSEETHRFREYDEQILRSALVLKLLSFDKTGAVLAAATTSLPETIGEIRNWDYRFCWLRDASMVIKVMTQLGHWKSAERFMNFIIDVVSDKDEKIQIMYGINKEKNLKERILSHFAGYEDSAPVRVGNAAYKQKQHDIYGILMDVIYQQFLLFEVSLQNSEELWTITRSIVRIVSKNWKKPDRGIWEIRTEQRHFVFSKLLCWVAIDRAIKVAKLIRRNEYVDKWSKLRDTISKDIIKKGWNEEVQAFTQSYGSKNLDASTLLMESFGFIDASDYRYISTVKATQKELSRNGLMYRYKNRDDFGLPTSSFTICTFWLIQALYKIGEQKQARELFEQLLTYSNHLGLFSEDIDFESKRLLGNFPQAYSHLALIETAMLFSTDIELKNRF